ncbi:MAG: iron-sulfur cluster assembly accessory protein [Cyanobacteria bacterium SID2]|nr:iron-sulfur cluster assembly accessory protein [Cyanobacteria bacterium SID2]MBP0006140.1 iron-sulfur cluster assembly accessory protein [Cyanobacteria bacterium SBC]
MIFLSQTAVREIARLQSKHDTPGARLRVRARVGGCAELYYDLGFDETLQPDDRVCECEGVSVVVDEKSLTRVEGLTVDYTEDLMGGGFRFYNPHAERTCSCGHSFVPRAEQSAPEEH